VFGLKGLKKLRFKIWFDDEIGVAVYRNYIE
jgi:hypothetical protein